MRKPLFRLREKTTSRKDKQPAVLLFDGTCGFCTWAVQILSSIPSSADIAYKPYQRLSSIELAAYGVDGSRLAKAVHLVSTTGRLYTGAFAINAIFWGCKSWILRTCTALLYLFWPLLLIEILGYYLVANNRYWISRLLGTAKCALIEE